MKPILAVIAWVMGVPTLSYGQEIPLMPSRTNYLSLKPERTVSFTTDEGSHMNVDVSPDGKTILFDLLGDLYSLPVKGGKATQLTRGIALNLRPVWSPDGKHMAYLSDTSGEVHLTVRSINGGFPYTIGKQEKQVPIDQEYQWLPGGQYIVMGQHTYSSISGNVVERDLSDSYVGVSRDGQFQYHLDSGKLKRRSLHLQTDTTLTPPIINNARGVLSSDERWWVYVEAKPKGLSSLKSLELASGQTKVLVASLYSREAYPASVGIPHFSVSPDSRFVYIGYQGKIHRIALDSGLDEVVPFEATVKSDLSLLNYHRYPLSYDSFAVRYMRHIQVDPSGQNLLFAALGRVYQKKLPQGRVYSLSGQEGIQQHPCFSPDGRWIAYVNWSDTAGGSLWKISVEGGKPILLSSVPGQYRNPVWSPDGQSLAVIRGPLPLGGRADRALAKLVCVSANGLDDRMLADSVPLWNKLSFSEKGNTIAFNNKEGLLVRKNIVTGQVQVLAQNALHSNMMRQLHAVSPDGHFTVYVENDELYFLPLSSFQEKLLQCDAGVPSGAIRFAAGMDPYIGRDGMIYWTFGNRLCRISIQALQEKVADAVKARQTAGLAEENFLTIDLKPTTISVDLKASSISGKGSIVLKNARLITMKGNEVVESGTIVVTNGRISKIGASETVAIPVGAKVYDLAGATIVPGFIDVHLHMSTPQGLLPQQSSLFLVNLAYGVTAARDPYLNYDSYGYADLLKTGKMLGPRLFTVGMPAMAGWGLSRMQNEEDARRFVQTRKQLGSIHIKQYYLPTRMQRQWLLQQSRIAKLNMTNEGGQEPYFQLAMLKDGSSGIEHSAAWGDVYKDFITLAAQSGTVFTPTLQEVYSQRNRQTDGRGYLNYFFWQKPDTVKKLLRFRPEDLASITGRASAKDTTDPTFFYASRIHARIRQAGGKVALGSHGNNQGIGVHNELWALQLGGLTNLEALQAATIIGAETLGIQKDLGSLESGKMADLLILEKNPLEDIHYSLSIRFVMQHGILYNADTLDQLWPLQQKCPEWKLKGNSAVTDSLRKGEGLGTSLNDDHDHRN